MLNIFPIDTRELWDNIGSTYTYLNSTENRGITIVHAVVKGIRLLNYDET